MKAPDWLARRAALTPERVAFIDADAGTELRFVEMNARANRTARLLVDGLGLSRGDRVAVLSENRLEYLDVWWACQKTGLVLQNLNWRLSAEELEGLVRDAAPGALVFSAGFEAVAGALPSPARVALDGGADAVPFADRDGLDGEDLDRPAPELEDAWVLCYTGGTTGTPKGAVLTQGNVLFNAINTVVSWGLRADDVAILNAPLFHTGGLNVFTAPLVYAGGCSFVCARFDPDQVFDLVARGATVFFGVPTMFQMMQRHERWAAADFSSCRIVISGGAPCPRPVFDRFFDKGVPFRTGYGLTEAGPNNFWLPEGRVRDKPGSVGQPLFHVQARLAPDGELLIRGPHVTPGYLGRPDATRETIDERGWLHTGDLAERDADGDFTIVGRKKEMFISGGENVYPARVEAALFEHAAVRAAAVVGVPDPKWGEVGVAFVVRAGDLDEAALLAHARARLAGYAVPRRVVFVDALPETGAGKVDRRALAQMVVTAS